MNKKFLFGCGILLTLAISTKVYVDTNIFKVNKLQFHNDLIPVGSEITILQITDLHNKVFGSHNEKLIDTVANADADIIVMTGDIIDRGTENLNSVFSLVEEITALNKHVYYVSGNHEWDNPNRAEFFEGLEDRQVVILNNKNTQITIGDITLNVVGIDDPSTYHEDMNLAFNNVDEEKFTILLSHSPGVTDRYQDIPADLILSGHTHGGQIRFPFIGALVAPNQGYFPELDKGTYEIGEDQFLYIDSGLGTSGIPVRFLNQSQVSLIRIKG